MGKPEGKRSLRRTGLRFKVNIKMDLQEGGWIGLIWLRAGTGGNGNL